MTEDDLVNSYISLCVAMHKEAKWGLFIEKLEERKYGSKKEHDKTIGLANERHYQIVESAKWRMERK